MAGRPTWQGHLRLSLVTCPIAVFKASEERAGVSFNLINPKTKSRVRMVSTDASTGEPVERKDLVKGYEVEKGRYILIEPADIDALKIESTKILDIERFVEVGQIDRIYWDQPYYMVPDGKTGTEAFSVILEAMREQGRVGIGRIVMSGRERACALEPREGRILMTTLRAQDEVRDADDAAGEQTLPKPDRKMLEIAEKIIEQQSGPFDPAMFEDRYEAALRELIAKKQKGQKPVGIESPLAHDDGNVVDLMQALRRSLRGEGGAAPKARAERHVAAKKKAPKRRAA
jgi:DNA end-binding protein Ku